MLIFKTEKKSEYSDAVKQLAFTDLGSLMFNLRFNYEFVADTLLGIADQFKLERKNAIRILRKNEDKFTHELYEKLSEIDVENKMKEIKKKNFKLLKKVDILEKICDYLPLKDVREFQFLNKEYHEKFKTQFYR
jgi:hypothetical protein